MLRIPSCACQDVKSSRDRKSTRLNSSHDQISYAVFCLKKNINEKLDELHYALSAAQPIMNPRGHLVVGSFHSLKDRIVKIFLVARANVGRGSRHLPVI